MLAKHDFRVVSDVLRFLRLVCVCVCVFLLEEKHVGSVRACAQACAGSKGAGSGGLTCSICRSFVAKT